MANQTDGPDPLNIHFICSDMMNLPHLHALSSILILLEYFKLSNFLSDKSNHDLFIFSNAFIVGDLVPEMEIKYILIIITWLKQDYKTGLLFCWKEQGICAGCTATGRLETTFAQSKEKSKKTRYFNLWLQRIYYIFKALSLN